jgi:hypothetical protein
MTTRWIRWLVVRCATVGSLGLCLAGCGGSVWHVSSQFGLLDFAAASDKAVFAHGEPVGFTFTVTNTGSKAVTVSGTGFFSSADPVPVAARVEKNGQAPIWVVTNNGVGTSVVIGPGESKTGRAFWDQTDSNGAQVQPGDYTVTVMLAADRIDAQTFTQLTESLGARPITVMLN